MSHNISGHWSGHSEPKRERQKYESIDVRIHAELIIIHIFSIALVHTDRAELACSHTCKLPIIIYADISETDREKHK